MANVYGQNNTTFPASVQTFKNWKDLTSNDANAYMLYMQALAELNTTKAKNALMSIENYQDKIPTALDFNQICDTIVACEKLYNEGITGVGIQQFLNNYKYVGVWKGSVVYDKFNMVTHDNALYMSLSLNINIEPTSSPNVWVKLSFNASITNSKTVWKGLYDSSESYAVGDLVSYNNVWYIALIDEPETPSIESDEWEVVLNLNNYNPVVSSTIPVDLDVGKLWYKVIG